MIEPQDQDSRRSGAVLIIVAAILAVLMVMAATLALLSRVELKSSENYETAQALDQLVEAVRGHAIQVLHRDKFGTASSPYTYDALVDYGDVVQSGGKYYYPARTIGDGLDGDDESFDSYLSEEWLPERTSSPAPWRIFSERFTYNDSDPTANDARLFDTDLDGELGTGDGYHAIWKDASDILGLRIGGLTAEFALYFVDLGGRRADINSTGNIQNAGAHAQSQGLTPFELSLAEVIDALLGGGGGGGAQGAQALIKERYGTNELAGTDGQDNNLLGPFGGLTAALDISLNGVINTTAVSNEDAEFNPEYPIVASDDAPFGPFDLHDLFWQRDSGSRAAGLLTSPASVPAADFGFFTTSSAGTILAGRSIRGGQTVFNNTRPAALSIHAFMQYGGGWLTSPTTGKDLLLQRAIHDGTSGLSASRLYQFLWSLRPVAEVPSGSSLSDAETQVLTRQAAVNLLDMLDSDDGVTLWDDSSSGRLYYGVEPTPYIAEVEAAVDTSLHPFMPNPATGSVTTGTSDRLDNTFPVPEIASCYYNDNNPANGLWNVGEEVWLDRWAVGLNKGIYNAGGDPHVYAGPPGDPWTTPNWTPGVLLVASNDPPTGWGKYIKLVNPWNDPIDLTNYKLVLPPEYPAGSGQNRLRKWVFDGTSGQWISSAYGSDITIPLSGTILPHEHVLVVDNMDPDTPDTDPPFRYVLSSCLLAPEINHMQEAEGEIDSGKPAPQSSDEFETGTWGPTVVELRTNPGNDLVMRFVVVETGESPYPDEDDRDDWPEPENYSTQITDPRPCWMRDPDGDGVFSLMTPADGPWALGGRNIKARTYEDWEDGTKAVDALAWFNVDWVGTARVATGDRWNLLDNITHASNLPPDTDNDDNLLHSFPPVATSTSEMYTGVPGQESRVMNVGHMANPGCLGFLHSAVEWCTLSLGVPAAPAGFGEADLVYLRNFSDYLTGPFSPFENDEDDDLDGAADDRGTDPDDRFGPEIRRLGRINVNTASVAVLRGAFSRPWLQNMWTGDTASTRAAALAGAIVTERNNNGPFSSVDDLFERVPQILQIDLVQNDIGVTPGDGRPDDGDFYDNATGAPVPDGLPDSPKPNSFRREAMVRFMYNLLTVRTDVWGVVGSARLLDKDEKVIADREFYFVLDRSRDPIRVILSGTPPY